MKGQKALDEKQLKKAIDGCDNEPIHIPGSIQPHGYLLVLNDNFDIVKVSENFIELVGNSLTDTIGHNLVDYITEDKLSKLREIISSGILNPIRYTTVSFYLNNIEYNFDAVLHYSDDVIILELERHEHDRSVQINNDLYQQVMHFSVELQRVHEQGILFDFVVDQIQKLTGFARVKLYKFDENWNGKVVAEKREMYMSSYINLHFPASDIPKQARALYARNYLRLIPDVNFNPVPILPDDKHSDGMPIDLSYSCLRSVSPVHMEYLRNMGVKASMSISVIQNNRLWGLIACHHNKPFYVPYPLRMTAELMAHTFSAYLSNVIRSREEMSNEQKRAGLRELNVAFSSDQNLIDTLKHKQHLLLEAVDADGVIISLNGKVVVFGLTPEVSFATKLINWIEDNHEGDCFVTESIGRDVGFEMDEQTAAGGVMAIPISSAMMDYLIWFRQEKVEDVEWAGRPEKSVRKTDVGYHLTPRASFQRWQENISGYARKWSEADVGIARSITRLMLNKKYRDSINQADYDLQFILNNSRAYIYILDRNGKIAKINEAAMHEFCFDNDQVIGEHYKDVFNEEMATLIAEHQRQVLETQQSVTMKRDFTIYSKDYHLISVEFPLYDIDDEIYAFCNISTDISELHQTQQELERSNKELERMAYIASHDLQEPIRMISSFMKLLQEEHSDKLDDEAKDYIDFAILSADRMKALVLDLLHYSRLNNVEEHPEPIDTAKELNDTLKQFKLSEKYKDANIIVKTDIPEVKIKPEHFSCLMQNLIGNGLKYQSKDASPEIIIDCEEQDRGWLFSVADNGIGIAPENQEKVFLIFKRLHNRDEYEGTGIGLALCARIVERYHGNIWVESEPGKGSKFFFLIPKDTKK